MATALIGGNIKEINMNKEETKKCIKVMQAFVDTGKVTHLDFVTTNPVWSWRDVPTAYQEVLFEPKKGDEVLVRWGDAGEWRKRTFVIKHEGRFWCEVKEYHKELCSWAACKPLEVCDEPR